MLSFKIITENDFPKELLQNLSSGERQCATEIVDSLAYDGGDVEYAAAVFGRCLIFRIYDMGRYLFLFPYALSDGADVASAIEATSEYAMREEIPLVFSDVPAESLSVFRGFRHIDIDAEDANAETYRVRIKTECELISEIPEVSLGRVTLNAISAQDIADYAKLCKDENVNKYWGYDYSEDNPSPTDEYFFALAREELARGVSMSMAIRAQGEFCGEAVLYAFDGRGSAEFAIRLLPRFHGLGLGSEALLATCEIAKSVGLTVLRSKVFSKNISSVAMIKKVAQDCVEEGDFVIFTIYLN